MPTSNEDHDHEHEGAISSLSLTAQQPMRPDQFLPWIQDVMQRFGADILHMKGIIAMQDDDQRFVVQGAHRLIEGDRGAAMEATREARNPIPLHRLRSAKGILVARVRSLPRLNQSGTNMDIFADQELRLRALVAVFATVSGLRLIVTGLRQPTQHWSLLVGGLLVALTLARTLPRLF